MRISLHSDKGQTLLEIVIALGVIALVITGLVVAATSSLRFSQDGRLRSAGVRYAQEGIEKARELRDSGTWDDFLLKAGGSSKSWCLDGNGSWTESTGSCGLIQAGSPFTREVTFTLDTDSNGNPVVTAVSTVTWPFGSTRATTSLKTYFAQWK